MCTSAADRGCRRPLLPTSGLLGVVGSQGRDESRARHRLVHLGSDLPAGVDDSVVVWSHDHERLGCGRRPCAAEAWPRECLPHTARPNRSSTSAWKLWRLLRRPDDGLSHLWDRRSLGGPVRYRRAAFAHGPWARTTPAERQVVIQPTGEPHEKKREELANLTTAENSSPIWLTAQVQQGTTATPASLSTASTRASDSESCATG